MGPEKIRVAGLKSLRAAFKGTGSKKFDKHLAKVHRKIAQDVVSASKPALVAVSSTTAAAVIAVTSATGARIRISRQGAPMAAGVIFGAVRDRRRIGPSGRAYVGFRQFRQFSSEEPYHLWPELRAMRESIADEYQQSIDQFFSDQGVPK